MEKNFRKLITPNKAIDSKSNGLSNSGPIKLVLTGDDALRSQYVPPEPTVKILKRPSKEVPTTTDNKIFHPKKTLKQREQEYAEARLRILGESSVNNKVEEKISIINKSKAQETENIIRAPRGPDGTKGFNLRR